MVAHLAFVPLLVALAVTSMGRTEFIPVEFAGLPRDLEASDPVEKKEDYDPQTDLPDRQVVDSPIPPHEDRRPQVEGEEAPWLSDRTVRVKQQMKSSSQMKGSFELGAKPAGPESLGGPTDLPGVLASPEEPGEDLTEDEEGTVLLTESPLTYQKGKAKPAVSLMPTFGSMSGAIQGTGIDSLEDVKEGPKTLLDTDEWKFAGFFNRVKQAVAKHWHPAKQYMIHDPTGQVYGYKDRETLLRVVLDCKGQLKTTYVQEPSGADFLDDEAVSAIKNASPFPNPPLELCDLEDRIIVFKFGFLVRVDENSFISMENGGT